MAKRWKSQNFYQNKYNKNYKIYVHFVHKGTNTAFVHATNDNDGFKVLTSDKRDHYKSLGECQ